MSLKPINELIPKPFSGKKAVLEVYKTDEENFIPYTSPTNSNENNTTEKNDEEETEETEETSTNKEGYTLHQGEILETYYYKDLFNVEWNKDYEGLSGDGRVTIQFKKEDMDKIYKGVRCKLRVARYDYNEDTTTEYEDTYLCFITDVTYNTSGTEITLSAFEKLLEQEDQLEYTQMLRSKILEEVIKTAGLEPVIDTTGLPDDIIDWSSKSDNDSSSGGDGSMSWKECWEIAQTWHYGGWGSNHDPQKAWDTMGTTKGHNADCFDATAWLYYVINNKVKGYSARDVCGHGNGKSGTHHVIQTKKSGGNWKFPEEYSGMAKGLGVTSAMRNGDYMVCRDASHPNKYTCCKWGTC